VVVDPRSAFAEPVIGRRFAPTPVGSLVRDDGMECGTIFILRRHRPTCRLRQSFGEPARLNQLVNTTAAGAASGSFWGLLVGLLFLNPIIGVALGAASGALGGALTDYGINDAFMKELSATLQPGKAALFVLVQEMTTDKVLKGIQDAGGTVLQTSLDDSKEKMLRDALAKATVTAPEATNPA
jgi:uncharacterized membrane protein